RLRKPRAVEPIRSTDRLIHIGVDHVSAPNGNRDVDTTVGKSVFVETHPRVEVPENSRRTSLLERCNVFELAPGRVHAPVRRVRSVNGANQQRASQKNNTRANHRPELVIAQVPAMRPTSVWSCRLSAAIR